MRKLFIFGATIIVSVAMLMTACKKDESNNSNTENSGGGNKEYPPTAVVIYNAVSDIDGNTYDAVQIGDQVWMAENLRTTKYADGTTIPLGSTYSYTEPYRYAPGPNPHNEENMANVARYGYLYNWPAVMHGASSSESNPSHVQGICPIGWHVPSDAEWTQLTDYVGSQSQYLCGDDISDIAKALASTKGWSSSSYTCAVGYKPISNNATGFSALPADYWYGEWDGFGYTASFWSATEYYDNFVYDRSLEYYNVSVRRGYTYKNSEISVRCVRD